MASTPNQPDPQAVNDAARMRILAEAVPMSQQIFSQSINPATQSAPVNVQARPVGLIRDFTVIVSGSIQNTHASQDASASPYGISNIFSQIDLVDLQSLHRITTGGWHLNLVESYKAQYPIGAAEQGFVFDPPGTFPNSAIVGSWGANWPVTQAPSAIQHGTTVPFRMTFRVPVSYDEQDLRGCIYANVAQAYVQLYLTINTAPFVASNADDTFAMFNGGTLAFVGNIQITVYQNYLDQLPTYPASNGRAGGVLLPPIDLATVYELKNTRFNAIAQGQDFPISYTSFRDFLSLMVIYNNNGNNTGHGVGSDITYLKLQSANSTPIYQLDPLEFTRRTRRLFQLDPPPGTYYVSHRKRPVSTLTYGNTQFVVNPSLAQAGAYIQVGWEDFALANQLSQAPSLAAAGQ